MCNIERRYQQCRYCTNFNALEVITANSFGHSYEYMNGTCNIDNTNINNFSINCKNKSFQPKLECLRFRYETMCGQFFDTDSSINDVIKSSKLVVYTTNNTKCSESDVKIHQKSYNTKEEALNAYKSIIENAINKAIEFTADVKLLEKKYNTDIDYYMDGDTHGIYNDGMYFTIDGINFYL